MTRLNMLNIETPDGLPVHSSAGIKKVNKTISMRDHTAAAEPPIFTVGHSNRWLDTFVDLFRSNAVDRMTWHAPRRLSSRCRGKLLERKSPDHA